MSASMIIKSSSLVPFHPERKNGSSFALIELGWPCPLLPRDQLLWNSKYGSLGPITMEDLTWLGGHTATGHPTGLGMIFFPVSLTRSKATQKVHWICMNSSRCCMAFFRIRGIDSHLCCLAAENWTYWTLVQKCWKEVGVHSDFSESQSRFNKVIAWKTFSRNIRPCMRLQKHWYHMLGPVTPNKKAMSCT